MANQEEIYQEEQAVNDDNEYSEENQEQNMTSENVKSDILASDFDPDKVLHDIRKVLLGFEKRNKKWVRVSEPLARTEFVLLYITSIRSLVNFHNMFSQVTAEESAFNMLESLKEITYASVDYGVKEEHIETLVNVYDTLKSTFYGIIIDGRGTENIKQVLTSVYKDLSNINELTNNNNNSLINWGNVSNALK